MSGSGGFSAAHSRAGSIPQIVSARHVKPLLRAAGVALIVSFATPLGGCGGGPVAPQVGLAPKSEPMFPETVWGEASVRVSSEGDRIRKGGGQYKIGTPYRVADKWYNPREQPNYDRVGIASWYGSDFHGRRTSNGEIYDMNSLTAAHPTLPMPSYVYVTNLANNRTILVRVNDRGPYVANRIIDLSKASANALNLHGEGTGRVRVTYAGPAPLDGDDSRERQFLAGRTWNGGPSRYADARYDTTGSIPQRPSYQSEPLPQVAPAWPAAQVQQAQAWALADGPDQAASQGWTAASYRQSLLGR